MAYAAIDGGVAPSPVDPRLGTTFLLRYSLSNHFFLPLSSVLLFELYLLGRYSIVVKYVHNTTTQQQLHVR
jgi:hypothetical protein